MDHILQVVRQRVDTAITENCLPDTGVGATKAVLSPLAVLVGEAFFDGIVGLGGGAADPTNRIRGCKRGAEIVLIMPGIHRLVVISNPAVLVMLDLQPFFTNEISVGCPVGNL